MALHKSPTAVTIAPTHEKSEFALLVGRYWKVAVILAVVASGAILIRQLSRKNEREQERAGWEKIIAVAAEEPSTGSLVGPSKTLETTYRDVRGTKTGPWALYVAATSAVQEKQFDQAKGYIEEFRKQYPRHLLLTETFSPDGKAAAVSPIALLEERIQAQRDWIASHRGLFENPELPQDAPRVRLNTTQGTIVVGLYTNLAPKHVENFLKLVREGYYSGTKFHRIVRGVLVGGGDPNSKLEDVTNWGKGGPGYTLEREEGALRHFAGVLSAPLAPEAEGKTSGSQFVITSGEAHPLDDNFVPFGKVIEGMDVVTQIEQAKVAEGATERPLEPVTIQSAEVL